MSFVCSGRRPHEHPDVPRPRAGDQNCGPHHQSFPRNDILQSQYHGYQRNAPMGTKHRNLSRSLSHRDISLVEAGIDQGGFRSVGTFRGHRILITWQSGFKYFHHLIRQSLQTTWWTAVLTTLPNLSDHAVSKQKRAVFTALFSTKLTNPKSPAVVPTGSLFFPFWI